MRPASRPDRLKWTRRSPTVEPQLARNRALQLLGYRERSAKELTGRLLDNGYPVSVVGPIVTRYREVELVDDARFATAWVRSRCSAGYGRRRIARELAEKGIADELATIALDEELAVDEATRAREALRGKVPRDAKERDRLVRRLVTSRVRFQNSPGRGWGSGFPDER